MYYNLYLLFSSIIIFKSTAKVRAQQYNPEVENHLELGRQLMAQGMYSDALSHYLAAIDGDPHNYLTYFKCATIYLALGKVTAALRDLTKVIEMKPDFLAARVERGMVLLRQGRLDEAHIDFETVLRIDPMNVEAGSSYRLIEHLKQDIRVAYALFEDRNYHEAIDLLSRLIHELPWDSKLREMRSECYEALGDVIGAISDLKHIVKSNTDKQERYLKLSRLHYTIGESEEALNAVRECLKFDPDHKDCFAHYKNIKKIAAHLKAMQEHIQNSLYSECVDRAEKVMPLETKYPYVMQYIRGRLCFCLNKIGETTRAIQACTEALKINPDDVINLCERADAYVANENYADALRDYKSAASIDENSRRAQEGIRRVQKLEKQSNKRDYYKILGVRRTAGKREILKAYRKLAQKWHPDNFQGDEKKTAEKKFIDIAAAKEVLTDPEKRQKFDNGDDPLDPETQAGQNFNPFAQGFNFAQGGPFSFKFHFS